MVTKNENIILLRKIFKTDQINKLNNIPIKHLKNMFHFQYILFFILNIFHILFLTDKWKAYH